MKRRNVFSFVFFVTLMFLLLACGGNGRPSIRQNWGELIVKNQTSKAIYYVSYCGKNIMYKMSDGGGYTKIDRGEEASVTFLEGQTGYLFFSADRDDRIGGVIRHFRTEDEIVLRVGETKTYLLTNDTTIFDVDKMQTGTMSEFFLETELKIQNKSAYRINYVQYKATTFKGEHCGASDSHISPGDSSTRVFYDLDEDEYSDYIYLTHNEKDCRVEEMVTIRKGKRTIFTITDDTPLQYQGRTVKLGDL